MGALLASLGSQTLWRVPARGDLGTGWGAEEASPLKGVGFIVGKEGMVQPEEELGSPAADSHLMTKTEPAFQSEIVAL